MISRANRKQTHGPARRFGNSGITLPAGYGHGRYQSLDVLSRHHHPSVGRPRVSSMLDVDPFHQRYLPTMSAPSPLPQGRPRIAEEDMCPICLHALPPKGVDGDETAREAHVRQCISTRDPTSAGWQAASGNTASAIHMVPFVATEKDCVGEDGNTQECSICMVDYDVGDELVRLECLCKFHQACIVEWFGRKQECPVHKIA